MNRDALIQKVKSQMPEQRWQHTLGVMESAVKLAEKYGADCSAADVAAILHDYCKYWPVEQQRKVIEEDGRAVELLRYDKPLWHAEAAAIIAEKELGIENEEIVLAIRYHTTGRSDMTLLEKVVCLADYIEPGRIFPGVNEIRQRSEVSLNEGLLAGFEQTIRHLLDTNKKIHPLTLEARNSLLNTLKK